MRISISNKLLSITASALKFMLGALFVFSALSKFVDIDLLNVYIFSFGVFSLNVSIVASWLLISAELVLGAALLSNRYHNTTCLVSLLMLLGFTCFLVVAQLLGRTDNCHCFGELLPFNPVQSMLKNAVLLLLLLCCWRWARTDWITPWWASVLGVLAMAGLITLSGFQGWRHMTFIDLQYSLTLALGVVAMVVIGSTRLIDHWWAKATVVLIPVVLIFILSVAAGWLHRSDDNPVDQALLGQTIQDELQPLGLDEGRHVVSFYSKSCGYCRMASRKLSAIQERDNLPADRFVSVFAGTDTIGLGAFYSEGGTRFREYMLDPNLHVRITYGLYPLVLLVEDGQVVDTYSHVDISERHIKDFLHGE